jgi:hypothetical protein
MLWTLASKDVDQIYTFAAENDETGIAQVARAKELLQKYFKVKPVDDEPAKFTLPLRPKKWRLKRIRWAT